MDARPFGKNERFDGSKHAMIVDCVDIVTHIYNVSPPSRGCPARQRGGEGGGKGNAKQEDAESEQGCSTWNGSAARSKRTNGRRAELAAAMHSSGYACGFWSAGDGGSRGRTVVLERTGYEGTLSSWRESLGPRRVRMRAKRGNRRRSTWSRRHGGVRRSDVASVGLLGCVMNCVPGAGAAWLHDAAAPRLGIWNRRLRRRRYIPEPGVAQRTLGHARSITKPQRGLTRS
jgi:hypothetical protein